MTRIALGFCAVLLAVANLAGEAVATKPSWSITEKIKIGGEGGWDYLTIDSMAHRLYVAHGNVVEVVDIAKDKVVGQIKNTEGSHGVALASAFGHGFVSCGKSNTVLMFDLKTLDTLRRTSVGKKPDAIIFDPTSGRVLVMNGGSDNMTELDPKTGQVVGTVALGGGPEFAVADTRGHVYINLEDKNQVVQVDPLKLTVDNRWPLEEGDGPSGIAMDVETHRIFTVCANKLMFVLNSDDGAVVAKFPIGKGVDAVQFDPVTKLVYSSNGEGNVTIIKERDADKMSIVGTLTTEKGARTSALDLSTHQLYLCTAEFGATPEATKEKPHPRPAVVPGSFEVLRYQYVGNK